MKKIMINAMLAMLLWQFNLFAAPQASDATAKYFSQAKGSIAIAVPPAMSKVMQQILFKICSVNNNLTGNIIKLPQKRALLALQQEKVDIAIITNEPSFVIKQCNHWQIFPFAATAIVAVVNPQQKLDNISKTELTNIFGGTLSSWQKLTGNKEMLHLIGLYPETVGGELFQQFVMRKHEMSRKIFTVSSGGQVDIIVTTDRPAIGFRLYSSPDRQAPVKLLAIDHIKPDSTTICSGKYPLAIIFYICYSRKSKNPLTPIFINYFHTKMFTQQLQNDGLLLPARSTIPQPKSTRRKRRRQSNN